MNPELVKKFFEGKCSPEEVHQVLIWINSEDGIKDLEQDFENFKKNEVNTPIESQKVLEKIHERISEAENESSVDKQETVRRLSERFQPEKKLYPLWKSGIVASLLLSMIALAGWLFTGRRDIQHLAEMPASIEYLTKKTEAGEKLTLKLNDGSIIQMNSNSMVRFPKSFTGNSREVYMQGHVFFDIHRDESKPFIVHSKDLTTSVLGTSFSIFEDSLAQLSQVAVLTGKVKVSKPDLPDSDSGNALFLEPMDGARFDGRKGAFKQVKVDYDEAFAWKDNVLVFQNSTFDEVVKKLERWYGVKFQVKRKITGRKEYSGKFDDQSLEDVLIGLSFTYDFKFEINKSTIIIL